MKKLIICYGPERSGKTTFANTKQNYTYVRFDSYWRSKDFSEATKKHSFDYVKLRTDLISHFKSSDNVIIDGWMRWPELLDIVKDLESNFNVEPVIYLVVTDVQAMAKRRAKESDKKKILVSSKLNYDMYVVALDYIRNLGIPNKILYNDNLSYSRESSDISKEDFIKLCYPKVQFSKVEKVIKGLGQLYHGIEVGPYKYGNFSHCEQVWTNISSCTSFLNKSVLDLGCYYGFFSFRAEENLASKVNGYDIGGIVSSSNKIAKLKNSEVEFMDMDLDRLRIKESWDIIMVMNVLHHLNAPIHVLSEVFKSSNETVVVGIDIPEQKDLRNKSVIEVGPYVKRAQKGKGFHLRIPINVVDTLAKEYGFSRVNFFSNPRKEIRKLAIYKKQG